MIVRIEQDFHTFNEAAAYKANYLAAFPPSTYGTNLRIGRDLYRQGWAVTGQRFPAGIPAIKQGAVIHQALDVS